MAFHGTHIDAWASHWSALFPLAAGLLKTHTQKTERSLPFGSLMTGKRVYPENRKERQGV